MYALTWLKQPLDRLADCYVSVAADVRERMAGAVERLNARLKQSPLAEGESRSGRLRITFVAGLTILFEVDESARTVTVARIGPFNP
ncbi:MAG: hypothetical protein U0804_09630 [Gemmataceae bacterium]